MIAVISDTHGNFPALQSVIAEIKKYDCEFIISLGDVAGYYCFINECIELLRDEGVVNILGNHDFYLTKNVPCPRSNSANILLEHQRQIISAENMNWLGQSVFALKRGEASFVHGGWDDPLDEYVVSPTKNYFAGRGAHYYFSGHTHIQALTVFDHILHCNPGSVGQPRDGNPAAAFALFDGNSVHLKRVRYDIDKIADAMKRSGFDKYYYEGLYTGVKIGQGITSY